MRNSALDGARQSAEVSTQQQRPTQPRQSNQDPRVSSAVASDNFANKYLEVMGGDDQSHMSKMRESDHSKQLPP